MKEFCVLIGSGVEESDLELFFGPMTEHDEVIRPDPAVTLHALIRDLGLVKNSKQAKDVKMFGLVPDGFSDWTIGKMKRRLTILKITE